MEFSKAYQKLMDGPAFQEGLKQFIDGSVPKPAPAGVLWIKKFVSVKEYNSYYQYQGTYCFLEKKEREGVWIGFCVGGDKIPARCKLLTDEESMRVDMYRRNNKIYPFPLIDVNVQKEKVA